MDTEGLTWIGIALLVIQSGIFSGLNLALFGVTAVRLKTMASMGDEKAARVLRLRTDSNFLLTTILWGNVGTNVLLTLLSDSVLAGAAGFVFSTFVITIGGEIIPQAYFSRNALRMAGLLSPILRLYQVLLFPIAKPSALILDLWLGKESVDYVPEDQIREGLRHHVRADESDIGLVEGMGAINFMTLDDVIVAHEGEPVDPESVLRLPHENDRPVFPAFEPSRDDPFVRQVQASEKRWVLIAPGDGVPDRALDAASFLRAVLFATEPVDPARYCHRPVIVTGRRKSLADVIGQLQAEPGDDVIDRDLILLWAEHDKRVITGADLLGYLLRGISRGTSPT
ncbi:MAG: DUF21 domain-containing protein [Planctomycetes bacterium]|nr:DUF21 domain-containing protein [Planctomycetota bacterium]